MSSSVVRLGAVPSTRTSEEPSPVSSTTTWTPEDSARLYQTNGWGAPYFAVNEKGQVEVQPASDGRKVNLFELTQDLRARGLDLPILIRFSDILADRIRLINEAFVSAIEECNYTAPYRGVFPVKVNQQRHVVNEVVEFGRPWQFGLEVGSKPELLIALAATQDPGGLIVCNGYKDLQYIETALIAQQFDKTVVIVLERLEEFELALKASERLGIRPMLGVRAKLSARGMGRWADSAGDRAKFGLSLAEIVELVDRLAAADMLDVLRLLHFHIGSQVSSIIPIKNALQEAAQLYVELARLGCKMGYIDVGGGLAIDYDGSQTDFHASKNYTLKEYAADVVATIQDACEKAKISEPTIVSESGRAVVAHQAVLVFDVVGANKVEWGEASQPPAGAHKVLQVLYDTYRGVVPKNVQEAWHDAVQAKEEAQNLFKYGYLSLRERALAERLFWHCCERIQRTVSVLKFVPEELQELQTRMNAIYYCNFSVFQSAPDSWAIDQLFPIMPLQRLGERPTIHARLADLTCDSDGMVDNFIDVEDVKRTLELHPYDGKEPYYLGMFLIGAYQETLGDLHNLFGDTNAVHVNVTPYGYRINHVVKGDSMNDVLRYVEHSPEDMIESVRAQAEMALNAGRMTFEQMRLFMRHYEHALGSYTYLTDRS